MSSHLKELSESYPISTNMAGFRWFSKTFASLCFGKVKSLRFTYERTICKQVLLFVFSLHQNIDLHALTGWIPERVSIRPGSKDFDADKEFKKVLDKFHKGQCLVTMATGDMGQADADRAGLVPTHAYALLDIQIVKVRKY